MAPVIDTIMHCFERPSGDRPWVGGGHQHGMDSLAPEELLPLMDAAGVDKALQVTSGTMGWDNRYSLEIAARHPDRLRVVARVDPIGAGVAERLAILFAEPHVGVRVTLRPDEADAALIDGSLDGFFAAAADQGVPVEVFACGAGARLAPVARRHPGLALMADHVGVGVYDSARGGFVPPPLPRWDELSELVPYPNVSIRVSAVPEMAHQPYPFPAAQGMLEELRDQFGAERLQWGSNYPPSSSACAYGETVSWIRDECAFLAPDELDLVLGGNAARVLGLETWT